MRHANATLLASSARTVTVNTADQDNYGYRGLDLTIDVTASSATPSVVFTVQGKDPASGGYYTILASAAITGVGTTTVRVYPGLTAANNTVANFVLPRTWRVNCNHSDADSITYTVGACLLV